ncbi:MAG TPA: acyl-CoA dehydrogenase family protein [Pseudonocardiaceae bacterium]|nr:acyl-CoA dehydrogenase family protein [Pseudonocardiaceae bacterium]
MPQRAGVNLLYSDVEEALRASVADLLAKRSAPADVLARVETDEPYDTALWSVLVEQLDVAALLVPEELGGVGGSAREMAVIAEELGRAVTPAPFLGSAVLATSALLACDTSSAGVAKLLRSLASGETVATLAVPLSTMAGDPFPSAVTVAGELTGTVTTVVDAASADVFVVPAVGPDGPSLYAVPAGDGVTVTPVTALDLTRRVADVTVAATGELLAGPDRAVRALAAALTAGAGILASEQLGVAQWCLDTTVRYVKERYQFGRPVGSFQALKHRLADVWLNLVTARAAARYAADCLAEDRDDVAVAVAVAQAHCSPVAVHAAEEAVQLHGGIGMTWEHPAHLFLKRAKSDEIALGTPGRHRAALAGLVDLPGPVA